MSKNIVYCADGTWNEPEEEENGVISPSNVFKLFLLLEKTHTQVVQYEEGVGTASGVRDSIYGGLFGEGIFKKIQVGYEFLAKNYELKDKIFLFGFSRGAYAIRALAKVIDIIGLSAMEKCILEPKTTCLKSQVNKLCDSCKRNQSILSQLKHVFIPKYKDRSLKNKAQQKDKKITPMTFEERVHQFKANRKPIMDIEIEVLGAWDTVERIGNPLLIKFKKIINQIDLHALDIREHSNIKNFYHALAIDEKRFAFMPTLVNENCFKEDKKVMQVWFLGSHSNIGGGYKQNSLSHNTLKWMVTKAMNHGLELDKSLLSNFKTKPNGDGTLRDETSTLSGWVYFKSKLLKNFRPVRKIDKLTKESNAVLRVAQSVYLRKENDGEYKPLGLPDKNICEIENDIV